MYLTTKLDGIEGIRHGFFTRTGGDSGGVFGTLNCGFGSGDDAARVEANRKRVAQTLGAASEGVLTAKQVHSARVVRAEKFWAPADAPEADAVVTSVPGLAIGVLTADCAPVLFSDRKGRVVGAAHAGWRGALTGVLEATVKEMTAMGSSPADIEAAVGPCIGPVSYEVRDDFMTSFTEADFSYARFFGKASREGHKMFDLPGFVAHRLEACGLAAVHMVAAEDTLPDEKKFFSYRRTCLRGEKDYGRQMSAIVIREGVMP